MADTTSVTGTGRDDDREAAVTGLPDDLLRAFEHPDDAAGLPPEGPARAFEHPDDFSDLGVVSVTEDLAVTRAPLDLDLAPEQPGWAQVLGGDEFGPAAAERPSDEGWYGETEAIALPDDPLDPWAVAPPAGGGEGVAPPPAGTEPPGGAEPPDEVTRYCTEHGITDAFRQTVALAAEVLPAGSGVAPAVEGDGESDERWLVLDLAVNAGWDAAHDAYDQLLDRWLDAFPPAARDRIRLTYSAR